MTTAAVQAHTTADGNPIVTPVCGITVEQSPSGEPNAKAKGNRLGRERAGGQEHWQPLRRARDGLLLRVVRSQALGVGTDDACLRDVVVERHRLLAVDHGRCPFGPKRAVQHVEPDHLEVEGHLEVIWQGDHAALRHAPVLRVALPCRQRLWRRAADQRHDRSADPRPSAEHECRRAEQGEQRWASRFALCKRRLREALAGAHRPWYLWRAKAGATETEG
eukprot:scaffold133317_cov62-Phaeocystis_antarctica.AAC.2